jgi:HK97 family phage major capsid protein
MPKIVPRDFFRHHPTAAAGSVTADDIIDLTLGVKQVVANTGSYFMNRATALMIYKFKEIQYLSLEILPFR